MAVASARDVRETLPRDRGADPHERDRMVASPLANPTATREMLERFGLATKHRLGQNFLVDDHVIAHILDLSRLSEATRVVEVGPGIGTLTLGIDDIGVQVAQDLTGAKIDDNKVLISASEDGGEPVAIGFRAKKANGKYRYFWLYKVKFGIPATNLTTKGESIEFSTPSIEGTVLRRNKLDGQGKHPWKAEVSEDSAGVAASIISGWYSEVYEPVFAA